MDWFKIVLLLLQVANRIADIVREKGQMDAGRDRALAEASASILAKTQAGKEILTTVSGMTEDEVDAALKALEPK